MKIKSIELKNFKFHHALEFNIEQKNCLIYGENGTGKSSIYEALYANFYHFKNKDIGKGRIDIREKYRHRDYPDEDMDINILFDNEDSLNKKDNVLKNETLLDDKVIYFANERVLREITEENFYDVIQNILQEHFPLLSKLLKGYVKLKREEKTFNTDELISQRIELDDKLQKDFFEYIPLDIINDILMNQFDEKFEIDFKIEDSIIEDNKLIYPEIFIAVRGVEDRGNFQNHFNEAKLKLIGIAIYFALAKKYETESDLKLLVLDDFLTSLDMANRKLIVQYILDNFGDYQKIILTHNIQFYNLIVKLLKIRNENEVWDIKNIFLVKNNIGEVATIRETKVDYLYRAKKELIQGEFHSSGNYLRKEFERIVHEFKQLLEIGKTEKLQNMIDALKSNDVIFSIEPHDLLNQINAYIPNLIGILNSTMDNDTKVLKVKELLEKINDLIIEKSCDLSNIKATLGKVEFYRNILFNPASHSDTEIEIYRKECLSSIQLLEELNIILKNLK